MREHGCILSKFYIKPQPNRKPYGTTSGCILSKFYIKPQPGYYLADIRKVVSYRNSTSNHNRIVCTKIEIQLYLIEILHQTTTLARCAKDNPGLYLIEILHQTTTDPFSMAKRTELYLIEILHQTTTRAARRLLPVCCILSKFYIKPQHSCYWYIRLFVVSYRNSTSNHNRRGDKKHIARLYLIEILHQTTTVKNVDYSGVRLYLIEILHQTTTSCPQAVR